MKHRSLGRASGVGLLVLACSAGCATPDDRSLAEPSPTPTATESAADPQPPEAAPAGGGQTEPAPGGQAGPPGGGQGAPDTGGQDVPATGGQDAPETGGQDAPAGQGPQAVPTEEEGTPVHGYLKTRYWGRWSTSENDQILYETLFMDIGRPGKDPVTARIMARASAQLGGFDAPEFYNIINTFDDNLNGRLYDAYVDFGGALSTSAARFGRQQLWDTPVRAYFDGLYVESNPLWESETQFGVYGGVPVELFESNTSNDRMVGAYAQSRPWDGGRVRIDYMHMDEDYQSQNFDDDLLGVGLWQTVGESLDLEGQYTMLNWDSRSFRVAARYWNPDEDFSARVEYLNLLQTQRQLVLELDPFYNALQVWFPYQQIGIFLSKGLGENFELQGGYDGRRVTDESDVGQFNRDYDRGYLTGVMHGIVAEGFSLSLTGELWDSGDQVVDTFALGLAQDVGEEWTFALGTYFLLYKFDVMTNSERDNDRTYYLNTNYRPSDSWTLDLNFTYEDAEIDDFYGLILGATWRF